MREREYMNFAFSEDMGLYFVLVENEERILIGTKNDVELKLKGELVELLHDSTNKIGTWLLNIPKEGDPRWQKALEHLRKAHELMHTKRRNVLKEVFSDSKVGEHEEAAGLFFEEMVRGNDPVKKYAALKIWEKYKTARDDIEGAEFFAYISRAKNLVRPFTSGWSNDRSAGIKIRRDLRLWVWGAPCLDCDGILQKGYIDSNPTVEYVYTDWSLMPIRDYYLLKLEEYGKCLVKCKLCGGSFISPNLRFKLCSERCKEVSNRMHLENRPENERSFELDRLSRSKYQFWYNNIKKMKLSPDWSDEEVQEAEAMMTRFQKEKNRMNAKCRHRRISKKELNDWYSEQERKLLEFMYRE